MIRINKMLLVGSTIKDAGKTTFVTEFIRKFKEKFSSDLYGVKSTVVRDQETLSGYKIQEETNSLKEKDTSRMLKAGCEKVFWLKCDEEHAEEGLNELLKQIPDNVFMICESNTIRNFVEPDVFIMIEKNSEHEWKKTALKIKDKIDLLVKSDFSNDKIIFKPEIEDIMSITQNGWKIK